MHGVVLGTGMGLEILAVIALHTENGLHAKYGVQVGVFTTSLLSASPSWVAEDIHIRTPESQFWIARIVGDTHRHVEQLGVIVVSSVPIGTRFIRDL